MNPFQLKCLTLIVFLSASFAQAQNGDQPADPDDVKKASPTASTPAVTPESTDPRQIMQAVEDRDTADKVKSQVALKIIDHNNRSRERVVQSWSMESGKARRQLMIFQAPADVRNMGMLSVDYDDVKKDDDQYLYLPSLKKTTRISSGDKSGSFMGTDLSYSDMTRSNPDDYEYTMKEQSKMVAGEDCWVIDARPITDKAKEETGYVKLRLWVSKNHLMTLQVKAWIREGRRLKFIKFGNLKEVGGSWMATKISARTMRSGQVESTTIITFNEVKADHPDVTEDLFKDNRRLEQGL